MNSNRLPTNSQPGHFHQPTSLSQQNMMGPPPGLSNMSINPAQAQSSFVIGGHQAAGDVQMIETGAQAQIQQPPVEQVVIGPGGKKLNRRLMIERVTLENFKSYYGRKEIGPLHKCFTAVVGPNGSGKSNLIECLLFVFGKRAKRMRLNKLSELIHNSAQHKDVTHATVRVYFQDILDDEDEPDYYEVVPGSKFEISRTVNRQSVSTYRINGNEASFKEVCDLLSQKGIDLEHNRFLILQGEVEQISLMKAKAQNENETGLLEYLEDIIGSNKHVERINQLDGEIERADDDRREKLSRVNACNHELQSLEADKNQAIDYLKKERSHMKFLNMINFIELGEGVNKLNLSIQAIEEKKNIAREVKEHKRKMMEENQGLVQEIRMLMATEDKAAQRQEQLTNEFRVLEKSDIQLRNDMKHNISKIHKANETINEIQAKRQKIIDDNTENERVLPLKVKELEAANKQRAQIEQEFERLEEKVREITEKLRKEKESLEGHLHPLHNEFVKVKQGIELKKQEMSAIQGKSEKVRAEIENIQNHINMNENKRRTAESDIIKFKEELARIQNDFLVCDSRLQEISLQLETKEKELQKASEQLQLMKQAQAEIKNKNSILTSLMKAQKDGVLSGIQGRLGDLGTIDNLYDCAVTTSCGVLDHIVVDTINNGEKCVQYLREHRIGTGKFICLDKIVHANSLARKQPFQPPEGSQRLFDLIKTDEEKFKDAFYFGLKDTLVCDGIDLATRIAYGQTRHRVVTLKGELIEKSGTMSGGGKPRTGGMSHVSVQEFSEEQIREAEHLVHQLDQKVRQIKEERPSLDEQKRRGERRKKDLEMQIQRADLETNQFKESMNLLQNRQQVFERELEKATNEEKRIQEILVEIDQDSNRLADINPQIEEFKHKIKKVEAQILEAGGSDYRNKKDELERMIQKCTDIEKMITRMRANLGNTDTNIIRHDKEVEKEKSEIKKLEECNAKLKDDIEKNTHLGEKLLSEMGAIDEEKKVNREQLDNRRNNFNNLKRDMQRVEDEEQKAKAAVEEALKHRNALDEQCKKLKGKVKENREKYRLQDQEFGFIFREEDNPDDKQALVVYEQRNSNAKYSQQHSNNHPRESGASQLQGQNEESSAMNPSKRVRAEPAGFEYHLQNTPITYNFTEEEIGVLTLQKGEIVRRLQQLAQDLERMNPNINIIQLYKARFQDFKEKETKLKEVEKTLHDLKEEHTSLKRKRHDEFMTGFNIISTKLKEMYRLITNGGDAELEALDALDPFSEGIQFHVRPLKKSWKQMSKLSGGEKTISSLSLIFALHHYKPSPLYCMDEIDAALDYKNVAIVGDYIKKRARNSQFLIISLRNNMFELAEKLVGIYKTFDITKTVTINPNKLKEKIMIANQEANREEEANKA